MHESLSVTAGLGWLGYAALNVYARSGSAVSASADVARKAASAIVCAAGNSQSLFGGKSDLLEQLSALQRECAEDDWDGHGALALDSQALTNAQALVYALPDGFPIPECAPEPDGSVSLDWIRSRHRLFSLSVGSGDRLAYAWLDGTDKGHGVARFDGFTLPPRVLSGIRATVNYGTTTLRPA